MRNRHLPLVWRAQPNRARVPPAMIPWLTDRHSLTSRIVARSQRFGVRVLSQALAVPHPDERAQLGLRQGELAWVREVVLIADGVAVVYARSILSRVHLRGCWRLFRGVGGRSLGAVLFNDPRIERHPLVSTCLDARDWRHARAVAAARAHMPAPSMHDRAQADESRHTREIMARLWARRSCFRRCGHDLMVTEVFLPAILDLTG